jgi:dTMP kinase
MTEMTQEKPRFISLEGGEGAGKSTQIKMLTAWFADHGIDVCSTREPGGSPGAEQIRDLLVKGATDRWASMTEALLMTASRAEHVERRIKPALEAGSWVLCDRFFDSSIAYQGAARGLGMQRVKALQTLALGDFQPDLTLILDLPVSVGLGRAKAREGEKAISEDRFEQLDLSFHETLRAAYLKIAAAEPDRCVVISADTTPEALQQEIRRVITQKYPALDDR